MYTEGEKGWDGYMGYFVLHPPQAVWEPFKGKLSGLWSVIYLLYTLVPLYDGLLATSSAVFSSISQKPCNIQICIICHKKGLFTMVLVIFVA